MSDSTDPDIDHLIASGLYDLKLNETKLGLRAGDEIGYNVIGMKEPLPDGSIPVKIRIFSPVRLKGREVEGTVSLSPIKLLGARSWANPATD